MKGDGPVIIEKAPVVFHRWLVAVLNRTFDEADARTGQRGPAIVALAKLSHAFVKIVTFEMAHEAVGLDNAAFIPVTLIVVAVKLVPKLRVLFEVLIVAVSLAVVFEAAAAGVTGAAGRITGASVGETDEIVDSQVNLVGAFIRLLRQLPEGIGIPFAHESVGQIPGLAGLGAEIVGDHIPTHLEVITGSDFLIIVAHATGHGGAYRLVFVLAVDGIDYLAFTIQQIDGRVLRLHGSGRCTQQTEQTCKNAQMPGMHTHKNPFFILARARTLSPLKIRIFA